jgi:hypothetical protein
MAGQGGVVPFVTALRAFAAEHHYEFGFAAQGAHLLCRAA